VEVGQVTIVRPTTVIFGSPLREILTEIAATEEVLDEDAHRHSLLDASATAMAGTVGTAPPTCSGSATDLTCN
jgi:hypothetical protein